MNAFPGSVSVVIPVLDGGDALGELLEQLFAQEVPLDFDVLIVDSGSRDGSLELARRYPVKLIQISPHEFDHGETRNLGIRQTSGEIVVLLTQDATPAASDFLVHIVRPFEDPRVAGVYGRQIPRPSCDVVSARNQNAWLVGRREPACALLGDRSLEDLAPMERYELCAFDSVCCAIRRSVWSECAYPRAVFGEDIAWGKAVITRGWKIAYEPSAAVLHSHRRSIAHEYHRTRICHATLFDLFGLATLPRLRDVLRACAYNLKTDLPYVWRQAPPGRERMHQMLRIAALSIASPIAQYRGIRAGARTSLEQ
jgi:rhamnosyltransferase